MTIREIAEKTGKSRASIYLLASKLGRVPTIEEVYAVKQGRPLKYKSKE